MFLSKIFGFTHSFKTQRMLKFCTSFYEDIGKYFKTSKD